jgi:sugar lactone lactonase YvrE
MLTGADGIALSCDMKRLYWTPLTSRKLYGIETDYFLSTFLFYKSVSR